MYTSTTIFMAAILALARIAMATPPACLIAAMGAQSNPADLKALCGTLEPLVYGNITEKCSGDAESAAISVYSATCLASASITISIPSSTSSSHSGSTTGTGKTTSTGSGSATATGATTARVTGSGSATTGTATGTAAGTESTKASSAGQNGPQSIVALLLACVACQYLL